MRRTTDADRAIDKHGPGKDGFVEEVVDGLGVVVPGTIVEADWLDAVQEELANAIESTGLTLDPNDNAQLAAAIRSSTSLQDAFNKSVSGGESPMIASGAEAILDFASSGNSVFGRAASAIPTFAGLRNARVYVDPEEKAALYLLKAGRLELGDLDSSARVGWSAPDVVTDSYNVQMPPAAPASKGALVARPRVGDDCASEFTPLDWGDTNGGGSGWTATVSGYFGDMSGAVVSRGMWSRVGNIVSFSIVGNVDVASGGTGWFDISRPVLSAGTVIAYPYP
ncbi:MAG: hypothetical protein H5U40_00665, partial [Polyangiaceae bacterium]|nr:hypothetical protein [Polyangiaceae bacterium]